MVAYTGKRGVKIFWELSLKPFYYQISGKRKRQIAGNPSENEKDEKNSPDKNNESEIKPAPNLTYPINERQDLTREQLDRWKKWIQEEMQRLGGDVSGEV